MKKLFLSLAVFFMALVLANARSECDAVGKTEKKYTPVGTCDYKTEQRICCPDYADGFRKWSAWSEGDVSLETECDLTKHEWSQREEKIECVKEECFCFGFESSPYSDMGVKNNNHNQWNTIQLCEQPRQSSIDAAKRHGKYGSISEDECNKRKYDSSNHNNNLIQKTAYGDIKEEVSSDTCWCTDPYTRRAFRIPRLVKYYYTKTETTCSVSFGMAD